MSVRNWVVLAGVYFCVNVCVFGGNFAQDFQAAEKLLIQGKYAEAEKAFGDFLLKHSKDVTIRLRPVATDEVYSAQALCALLQGNIDKANEYCGKIKDQYIKKSCVMELLSRQRKYTEMFEILKDEDFSKWPERLVYYAAMNRGRVLLNKDNAAAAEKDYLLALSSTIYYREKASAYSALGNLYERNLNDIEKAEEMYKKAIEQNGTLGTHSDCVISYSNLLMKKGNFDEAIAMMESLNVEKITSPDWQARIYVAYGDLYLKNNDKAKAAEYYGKAGAVTGLSEYMKKEAGAKSAALKTE